MHINILTLFPEWFTSPLQTALLAKAQTSGLIDFELVNPRDFTTDKRQTVDDRPYGGGPGMVMLLEPLYKALSSLQDQGKLGKILLLAANGRPFKQIQAEHLASTKNLTLICGRYEGIDARLLDLFDIQAVSVGQTVLNGGEIAALAVVESVARLIPGFMGKEESGQEESFSQLLEYPHYTRPEEFNQIKVPEVLSSGDHGKIASWRQEKSLQITMNNYPELLDANSFCKRDLLFLQKEFKNRERLGRNLHCILVHHPVILGDNKVGTTALTNLDIHDIARSSFSYGVRSFGVVTPLTDQQAILNTLLRHWTKGAGSQSNPDRAQALNLVRLSSSLEEALESITQSCGEPPVVIGTTAREDAELPLVPAKVRELLTNKPVALIFGTGHGLAPAALALCDHVLRPLRFMDEYNHLPVRAAVAIYLDRILQDYY